MLQTERVIIRNYEERDFGFLKSLLADKQMMRYIGSGETRNEEQAKQFLNWIYNCYEKNDDYGLKIIELKETNQPIGHAGLVPQTVNFIEEIEIGYWISPNYWGKGFATEVAKALKDYGEAQLHLHRMIALIQIGNKASQKVAAHIGMEKEKEIELNGKRVNIFSTRKNAENQY